MTVIQFPTFQPRSYDAALLLQELKKRAWGDSNGDNRALWLSDCVDAFWAIAPELHQAAVEKGKLDECSEWLIENFPFERICNENGLLIAD